MFRKVTPRFAKCRLFRHLKRVFMVKPGSHTFYKFPSVCGIRRFITMFRRYCHWSVSFSQANPAHGHASYSFKISAVVSCYIDFLSELVHLVFTTKILQAFLISLAHSACPSIRLLSRACHCNPSVSNNTAL
jgi:hypothetical protein